MAETPGGKRGGGGEAGQGELSGEAVEILIEMLDEEWEAEYAEKEEKLEVLKEKSRGQGQKVDTQVKTSHKKLKQVESESKKVDRAVRGVVAKISRALSTVTNAIVNVLDAFGIALPPFWSAIMSTITVVATTLYTIATANMSNPYTLALGIAIMAVTTAMEIMAIWNLEAGKIQVDIALNASRVVMQEAQDIISIGW